MTGSNTNNLSAVLSALSRADEAAIKVSLCKLTLEDIKRQMEETRETLKEHEGELEAAITEVTEFGLTKTKAKALVEERMAALAGIEGLEMPSGNAGEALKKPSRKGRGKASKAKVQEGSEEAVDEPVGDTSGEEEAPVSTDLTAETAVEPQEEAAPQEPETAPSTEVEASEAVAATAVAEQAAGEQEEALPDMDDIPDTVLGDDEEGEEATQSAVAETDPAVSEEVVAATPEEAPQDVTFNGDEVAKGEEGISDEAALNAEPAAEEPKSPAPPKDQPKKFVMPAFLKK